MIETKVRTAHLCLLLMLLLAACQPIQALPATQTTATGSAATKSEEANQAVVQRFYTEVVDQKNLDALTEIFDAKMVAHDLDFVAHGGDLGGVLTGLPDVKTKISLWVVKDDLVTAVVTFSGTHKGPLLGIAPTGKPVTFSIIDTWRVKDGKLVEIWHNVPNSDILRQIQGDSAAPTTTGKTEMEAANQAVVQRFYEEVVNQKKVEVFKEVFDPKMTELSLGFGPQLFRDTDLFAGFPDLHLKVDLLVVKDDLVTAVVTVSGTQTGKFIGIAPSGKKVTWSQIDIWRVQNGKITDVWHNFASADILQQVGYKLVPPTK